MGQENNKMRNDGQSAVTSVSDELVSRWWETSVLDATGEYVWDEEVKAVNAMMAGIEVFPEWALQIRDAMPKYGFELCSHRWLDGLDDVIRMIGAEEFFPSDAGHCGDIPGRVVDAAIQRTTAVQRWLEGGDPTTRELDGQVTEWLGEPTPEKREAATCFVELIRAHFLMAQKPADDEAKPLTAQWRARADQNEILKLMFEGEGFDGLLENRCGFKVMDRLDLYMRIIGGDHSQAGERHGVCNDQLRFVLRDDPARFDTTRGYLWGWQAYLLDHDEEWLQGNRSECAGAAIYALQGISRAGGPNPLRRWLVASLLKSSKIWCQCMLNNVGEDKVPTYARDLPDVVAAIKRSGDGA